MKINTKYNVGQVVYVVYFNDFINEYCILNGTIENIKIFIFNDDIVIRYYIDFSLPQFYDDFYLERCVFSNIDDAKKYVKENIDEK